MAYRKVYFRIKSSYIHDKDWPDSGTKSAFQEETRSLFQSNGWYIQPGTQNGACDTAVKGQQDLYLHPMNFSGVILEDEIPRLEKLFEQAGSFFCYHTNRYEEYLNLSDDAYRLLLESMRADITDEILKQCRTKRKNLFVVDPVALNVAGKFAVCRLSDRERNGTVINLFVSQIVAELVSDGRLISAKTKYGEGLRTATEAEWPRTLEKIEVDS